MNTHLNAFLRMDTPAHARVLALPRCLGCGRVGEKEYGLCPLCGSEQFHLPGAPRPRLPMGRLFYHRQRQQIWRIERDAAFLQHRMPLQAAKERDHAESLRREIAAPDDVVEQKRNARWHRLRAALLLAAQATRTLRDARALARAA